MVVARPAACAPLPHRFTGVALPAPQSRTLPAFTAESGIRPQVVEYYAKFGDRFTGARAATAAEAGAVPLMQWIPPHYDPLAAIGAGRYDAYARRFAAAVREFRCPLMISFGHEFNGPWWPWGRGRQAASSFVAAWRHLHRVFTAAGAANVIWVWNPNVVSGPAVADPAPWWPGPGQVNMVALDGYDWGPSDTFTSVFTRSVRHLRRLTRLPAFIAETGAYPGSRMPQRIRGLFAGAARARLAGVIYFDLAGVHDWRLGRDPAALAAYAEGARKWR